ncbi:GDP-mannose 4,6-dehydratase [Selenomonas ruminantium]|uniref:GDP-mannose 4,6-dehydratase n=1 Tax=Selenomonas ruminantium TaxID=971 RepID=UPI00047BB570|nr:GDP-mannose 4,6-dehydratase [Selenomonas ruminantium]
MKVLITGAGGFVGSYLIDCLREHGHEPVALGLGGEEKLVAKNVPVYAVNILDEGSMTKALQKEQPDAVIHLAAISNVPKSWEIPDTTAEVNICGTIKLVKAMVAATPNAKLLVVGSSDEYGLTAKNGVPLTEDMPCQPQNPYSISKYCAEQMALQLGKKYGLKVICTRSFNHFGPGQAMGFAISDFVSQIVAIERGEQAPVLKVGDLSASRDFTYVTDVVEAYVKLIENDTIEGVFNVCSGKSVAIGEMLEMLKELSSKDIEVVKDESNFRIAEVHCFTGNNDKLVKITNWKPMMMMSNMLEKTLEGYRV